MRILCLIFLVLGTACSPSITPRTAAHAHSVLFVGNSLTFVGNTPAVFDALAIANGTSVSSDMIVEGGATLTERLNDGSIASALAAKHYTDVVLQERGGDLMCAFGPSSCADSRKTIQAIVYMVRKAGAKAYLLGTYQENPRASEALVAAESDAAAQVGIPYLEVSRKLQTLRLAAPAMDWFAADGMHPGPALTLLNATLLHQALLGNSPQPDALVVNAPIYGITSGLTATICSAEDPPPLDTTPRSIKYSKNSLQVLLRFLDRRSS